MSPFRSKAQVKFLFATNPTLAREFESKTKSIKALPKRLKKRPTIPKLS